MPRLTRSLAVAGLSALLAVSFTLPGVGVAQRDRLAPTACTAAPRAVANDAIAAAATPVPVSANESGSGANLSLGEAADPETVAQVTAAVQELAGCLNAADASRFAALLMDAAIAAGIDRDDFTPFFVGAGAVPWEIVWLRARNVRVLPDGRVGADVAWGVSDDPQLKPIPESNVHVYARGGDRWLLDAVVRGNVANQGGVGAPGGDTPAGGDIDPILRRATQGFNEVDSALYAEPTMAGAKFGIAATVMVGFVGNDDYDGIGCEMFICERGEASATVSAYCRAEEALVGRAAYLEAEVLGPHRGSAEAPNRCEDVALLAASLVFPCTVDLPEGVP